MNIEASEKDLNTSHAIRGPVLLSLTSQNQGRTEGSKSRRRQRLQWLDDVKELPRHVKAASNASPRTKHLRPPLRPTLALKMTLTGERHNQETEVEEE